MKNKEKTNKQIYTTFVLMISIGCIGGFIVGVGGAFISDMYGGDIVAGLYQIFKIVTPVAYALLMIVCYGYTFYHYLKAKKMVERWDGIEEEVLDKAEEILGLSMIAGNIMQICNFFFFSAMAYISGISMHDATDFNFTMLLVAVAVFILNMVVITVIQKLTVDLTKKMNPEKTGNIFDKDFSKVWLASCDEAQKWMIYEAAYMAYQATQIACIVMWMLTSIGMMTFDIGIIPSACVCAIWLTMTIAYCIACRNIEKRNQHKN